MLISMSAIDPKNLSRTDVCLWLDFYGQLLTSHTRDVLDLHYGEDMSLSEIAENLGISRQAVHDRIRQGVQNLADYEGKLELVKRFRAQKTYIEQAIRALDNGESLTARNCLLQMDSLL